ncbi:MAG TPA: hypothetical protein DCL54_00215 [Alphaproteobacteria bacterium]|nr:hypothetical protein [Alphaproteobacteria bacterium]
MQVKRFGGSALGALILCAALLIGLSIAWSSRFFAPPEWHRPSQGMNLGEAQILLKTLLGDEAPHPVGSEANKAIRDRIVTFLTEAGYTPEIQSRFQCSQMARPGRARACAQLDNVFAVLKGREPGNAILATAHYDSVGAGPGAADDGHGVAVMLMLAKALKAQAPPRNDIVFLLSDAEEVGLLGATAFAVHHPLMASVRVVVNAEARGASGPSFMFETGAGNAKLIGLYAAALSRPVSDSLAYEVYRLLPNNTDYSVYKARGINGLNFAFTGAGARYHSSADTLALLDPRSFQHQGDNVFEAVAALKDADLSALNTSQNAAYFDVFGYAVLHWPDSWNAPITGLCLLALGMLIVRRRSHHPALSAVSGVLVFLAVPAMLFGVGWLLSFPLGIWPGAHPIDHAMPWPGRIALLLSAVLVPALLVSAFGFMRRVVTADAGLLSLVVWFCIGGLALAVSVWLPGAAHPFLLPVVVFAVVSLVRQVLLGATGGRDYVAPLAGLIVAALIWISYFNALEVIFGFAESGPRLAAMTVLALALFAFLSVITQAVARMSWVGPSLLLVGVGGAAALGALAAPYSPEHPRGLNLFYLQNAGGEDAAWGLSGMGSVDVGFARGHGFGPHPGVPLPGGLWTSINWTKGAGGPRLPAPAFEVVSTERSGDMVTVRARITAARAGQMLGLSIPNGSAIEEVSVNGEAAFVRGGEAIPANGTTLRLHGLGGAPGELVITRKAEGNARLKLFELSALPDTDEARAMAAARPVDAAPYQTGDAALVGLDVDLAGTP